VCVHAGPRSSRQWRPVAAGRSGCSSRLSRSMERPPWPDERALFLADEVALLELVWLRSHAVPIASAIRRGRPPGQVDGGEVVRALTAC
jgi:hypothetical protein